MPLVYCLSRIIRIRLYLLVNNIGGVEQGYSLYNTTNSNKKIMLTDCYYLNSISLGGVNGNNYAAGSTFYEKTSDEMKNGTAFANWSTDIWTFESGKYPTLKNTPGR